MLIFIKKVIKFFIPYGIISLQRLLQSRKEKKCVVYRGNYASWQEAEKRTMGYNSSSILEKVIRATEEVINGNAVFERDSVLFYHNEPNYPLITAFLTAFSDKKQVKIVDFGGSLGSVYFQNRKYLTFFEKISWCIVEQPHFVSAGKKLFPDDPVLSFYNTLEEAVDSGVPDIILFSSSLQYLPDWKRILEKVKKLYIQHVFIDRCLCFKDNVPLRYCVQEVNEPIYEASYPVQIFNNNDILSALAPAYSITDNFSSEHFYDYSQEPKNTLEYRGMIFKLNNTGEINAE